MTPKLFSETSNWLNITNLSTMEERQLGETKILQIPTFLWVPCSRNLLSHNEETSFLHWCYFTVARSDVCMSIPVYVQHNIRDRFLILGGPREKSVCVKHTSLHTYTHSHWLTLPILFHALKNLDNKWKTWHLNNTLFDTQ